jgi:hypothetical protein
MTVIAYRDGILASDSMMTDDCGVTSVQKIWRLPNGSLFGGAGSAGYVAVVRDWLMTGGSLKHKPDCSKFEGAFAGCIIIGKDGSCSALDPYLSSIAVNAPHYAVGSGAPHANTLMAIGYSAEDAVRVIVEKQLADGVGGEIQTLTLRRKGANTRVK